MSITDEDWLDLRSASFETASLLRAVDDVDELRGGLDDDASGGPPQIRTDMLRLHALAMQVINEGSRGKVLEMFDLVDDVQDQVSTLMEALDRIQDVLDKLNEIRPESLDDDFDGEA